MPLGPANLSELKAALKGFMAEESFDDGVLGMFVALADADLRRELRLLPMERTATVTISEETEPVPDRFLSVRRFTIDHGGQRHKLTSQPAEIMADYADLTARMPSFYTIEGNEGALPVFRFYPLPDQVYTAKLLFDADPALLDDDDFNDLLLQQPDLYLYGALLHAEAYVKNPERSVVWGTLYGRALSAAKSSDLRDRYAGGTLAPTTAWREYC